MKRLSYHTLKEQNYTGYLLEQAPERVLQFGEGNFLRAFADYFIDVLNEKTGFNSKIVVVQPRQKRTAITTAEYLNGQDGLYTVYLRGYEKGCQVNTRRVISCVSRCLNAYNDYDEVMKCAENPHLRYIVSNTTEAGIVYDPACQFTDTPAASFPGKLTQLLYRRFTHFGTEKGKGFVLLPCELIDDNGKALKECVRKYADQWQLGENFLSWLEKENLFCSTLVDRIVTGYPQQEADLINKENNYEDRLLTTAEAFGFWVIEGPDRLKKELPFENAELPVLICDDHKPYKERKVRILNGAHTSMVPGAFLSGQNIVRDSVQNPVIGRFMEKAIQEEIIPTLSLPEEELQEFAQSVQDRFVNPFIDHSLLAICLNCTSKWKARVLPSLHAYVQKNHALPGCLTASFAFYIALYRGGQLSDNGLLCRRRTETYLLSDDAAVLKFYDEHRFDSSAELAHAVCTNWSFWGENLSLIPGFEKEIIRLLEKIEQTGTYPVMMECL